MQQGSLFARTVCVIAILILGDGLLLGYVLVIPRNTGCPDCDATGGTDPIHPGTGNSHRSEVDYPPFGVVAAFMPGNGQRYTRRYNTDGRIASCAVG